MRCAGAALFVLALALGTEATTVIQHEGELHREGVIPVVPEEPVKQEYDTNDVLNPVNPDGEPWNLPEEVNSQVDELYEELERDVQDIELGIWADDDEEDYEETDVLEDEVEDLWDEDEDDWEEEEEDEKDYDEDIDSEEEEIDDVSEEEEIDLDEDDEEVDVEHWGPKRGRPGKWHMKRKWNRKNHRGKQEMVESKEEEDDELDEVSNEEETDLDEDDEEVDVERWGPKLGGTGKWHMKRKWNRKNHRGKQEMVESKEEEDDELDDVSNEEETDLDEDDDEVDVERWGPKRGRPGKWPMKSKWNRKNHRGKQEMVESEEEENIDNEDEREEEDSAMHGPPKKGRWPGRRHHGHHRGKHGHHGKPGPHGKGHHGKPAYSSKPHMKHPIHKGKRDHYGKPAKAEQGRGRFVNKPVSRMNARQMYFQQKKYEKTEFQAEMMCRKISMDRRSRFVSRLSRRVAQMPLKSDKQKYKLDFIGRMQECCNQDVKLECVVNLHRERNDNFCDEDAPLIPWKAGMPKAAKTRRDSTREECCDLKDDKRHKCFGKRGAVWYKINADSSEVDVDDSAKPAPIKNGPRAQKFQRLQAQRVEVRDTCCDAGHNVGIEVNMLPDLGVKSWSVCRERGREHKVEIKSNRLACKRAFLGCCAKALKTTPKKTENLKTEDDFIIEENAPKNTFPQEDTQKALKN